MAHVTLRNELQQIKQLLLLNNKTVLTPDEVSLMYGLSKDYLYLSLYRPGAWRDIPRLRWRRPERRTGCRCAGTVPSRGHNVLQDPDARFSPKPRRPPGGPDAGARPPPAPARGLYQSGPCSSSFPQHPAFIKA